MTSGWRAARLGAAAICAVLTVGATACGGGSNLTASGGPPTRETGHLVWGRRDTDGLHLFTSSADGADARPLLPGAAVERPTFSPDGTKIAVAYDRGAQVVAGVGNADGTGFHPFGAVDATLSAACVLWSPSGERLACEAWDRTDPSRAGIYTVRASDGGGPERVTHGRGVPCAWSPGGSHLAFLRPVGGGADRFGLYVVRSDGSRERRIGDLTFGRACDWSPDGETILTEQDGSLVLVGLDGNVSTIDIQAPASETPTLASDPSFSPDGSGIVFSFDAGDGQADIYTMHVDGSDLTRITDTPQDEGSADWGR